MLAWLSAETLARKSANTNSFVNLDKVKLFTYLIVATVCQLTNNLSEISRAIEEEILESLSFYTFYLTGKNY